MVMVTTAIGVGPAYAQSPVCPLPEKEELYYTGCRPRAAMSIIGFLSDFAVDHRFKFQHKMIHRETEDFVRLFARQELFTDESLMEFVRELPRIMFTSLDAITGTFVIRVPEESRWIEPEDPVDRRYSVAVRLPEKIIEGGYWRGAGVLQMAFWKDHRPEFLVKSEIGPTLGGKLACLVLSREGLRLDIVGENTPSFMVFSEGCE